MNMRSSLTRFQSLGSTLSLALGLCSAGSAWAVPSIESVTVTPTPLITGRDFTIEVPASEDVTSVTATVDFHPAMPRALQIPLTKRGTIWTGTGATPANFALQLPGNAGALVRVAALSGAHRVAESVSNVGIHVETISAVLAGGVLTVTGDNVGNTIIVGRDIAGTILVNGGAVAVLGGIPTVMNTSLVRILGLGGDDVLTIDDSNGPMPPANLVGGDGDDVLTGSASDDVLDGGAGNDTLDGRGGNDQLFGGPGNDVLIGGRGNDVIAGGDGDDTIIWNPGDGSDIVEGDAGADALIFNGSNIGENIDVAANGARLRFFRDVGNITMDCAGVEQVIFHALGGADRVNITDLTGTGVTNVTVDLANSFGAGDGLSDTVTVNGTATNDVIILSGSTNGVEVAGLASTVTVVGGESGLDSLVINALGGDDVVDASVVEAGAIDLVLNGGAGNDTLTGGAGNDVIIGAQGTDTMFGGAGDDTFVWNPGDGSDVIEGQAGQDTLLFNGANVNETVNLSANGQRLRFFRDIANITMDCGSLELVRFNALGGADTITVNDLSATAVTNVTVDLASPAGSNLGDKLADTVIVNGTTGNDVITVSGDSTGVSVLGLAAVVNLFGTEATLDQLRIFGGEGDDVIEASGLKAGALTLIEDGGPGADILIGSEGPDVLLGGEGDDILNGGPGLDVLDGGTGNNVLFQD
jgi:Ca2+-binding RTX toxin-like protein